MGEERADERELVFAQTTVLGASMGVEDAGAMDYGARLAPGARLIGQYAASAAPSRGRRVAETLCPTRSEWQRDRDRIVHCSTFRRLTYKTQMFVYHEGDHYRTRLTHSLEVAQIARTIARQLMLDEDLTEALALAHDLGHPPFGHAGERALDTAVGDVGGFDHNVQSFRVVTSLEAKYADFDGLNLSWECLEGLIKHNGPPALSDNPRDQRVVRALSEFQQEMDLQLSAHASGEAQVAALADDIAWHTHDIDDGLRAGLIGIDDLGDVALVRDAIEAVNARALKDPSRDIYEIVRWMITVLIGDVVAESRSRLRALAPREPDDIRCAPRASVAFSEEMSAKLSELRSFLFARLYRNPRVMTIMDRAEDIVRDLVSLYREAPSRLPDTWQDTMFDLDDKDRTRAIADFVAGMTDRFAIAAHRELFDVTPDLR